MQKEFKDLTRLKRDNLSGMLANKDASKVSLVRKGTILKPRVMTGKQWLRSQMKVKARYSRTLGIVGFLATLPDAYKQANKDTEAWINEDDGVWSTYAKMSYTLGKYASGVGFIQKQWQDERKAYLTKHADALRYGTREDRRQVFHDAFVESTSKITWEVGKGIVTMPITMIQNIGGLEKEGKGLIGDILNKWDAQATAQETASKLLKYKQETSWRALQSKRSFAKYQKSIKVSRVDDSQDEDKEADLDTDDAMNLAYGQVLYTDLKQAQRDYGDAAQRVKNGDKSAHLEMTRNLKRVKAMDAQLNGFLDDPDTARKSEMSKRQAAQFKRHSAQLADSIKQLKARDGGARTSAACTQMHNAVDQLNVLDSRLEALFEQGAEAMAAIENQIARLNQQGADSSALDDQRIALDDAYENGDYRGDSGANSLNDLEQQRDRLNQSHGVLSAACYQDQAADWPPLPGKTQTACEYMQDAIQNINRLERSIDDTYQHGNDSIDKLRQEIAQEQRLLQEDQQRRAEQRATLAAKGDAIKKESDRQSHNQALASIDAGIASGDWGGWSVYAQSANKRKGKIAEHEKYRAEIQQRLTDGEYQVGAYMGWGPRINTMREDQLQARKFMLDQQAKCYQ